MNVAIKSEQIADLCQRYSICKLSLFGSVLRDDFRPDSDVDMLVEFEPEAVIGLRFIALQDELSTLLGREVDLNTPNFLSRHFRQRVMDTAQVLYDQSG